MQIFQARGLILMKIPQSAIIDHGFKFGYDTYWMSPDLRLQKTPKTPTFLIHHANRHWLQRMEYRSIVTPLAKYI